jgi:hypothetical protein
MKATGVIRIDVVPGYPMPGSIQAEREDGKFHLDFTAFAYKGGFRFEIPYTADNIQIAKSFWKVRCFKVSVELFDRPNPFTAEEFDLWEAEDKKAQLAEQKKVKALELEREKILKALPGLDSTFQAEFSRHMAMRALADDKRQPAPEMPPSLETAKVALEAARNRCEQILSEATSLKSGIYL